MAEPPTYLITGAGGGVAGVSPQVVTRLLGRGEAVRAMVHHDDDRADALRAQGAEVIAGDLTNPVDVFAAVSGITRMFFNMSVSPDYLQATTVVCVAAEELGGLEVLVNMSQMTVSQMTATSTEESKQQRLHWLAERVINWSGVPAVHVRPTVLLENPLFGMLAARSIRETGQVSLPFGSGRTSPVASSDVADVIAVVLEAPRDHLGAVYELTGPATLSVDELAEQYSQALGRPVTAVRPSLDEWLPELGGLGLPPHVEQHIATMARLHGEDRYNRSTDDVERIIGRPAESVRQYVERNRELFG
ncbi:NAD(P)H-binding protein [Mycobacterium sp. 1245805.9]|uniref:NmrA family NAD(P)-binding protein n=1 Tax=Mycobacterium sp. 1245805.9 TaxID=1856862 RepID=UPI00080240D4|nr:NAD(P)H-binding protein [Mycobacterium sp. 1245805.9]OBI92473.1 hydroxylase [Mycobacterium sp. 1245805.9]